MAIALYRKDPFNPWAIARRRISALQKAIVMKYVDNLLDWADTLFTQFTMESVNEAMLLYVMASDVLGPRPAELGDCGTSVEPKTYEHIAPMIDANGEVLVELETWTIGWRTKPMPQPTRPPLKWGIDWDAIKDAVRFNPIRIRQPIIPQPGGPDPVIDPRPSDRPRSHGPGPRPIPLPIDPSPIRIDPEPIRATPCVGGAAMSVRDVASSESRPLPPQDWPRQ